MQVVGYHIANGIAANSSGEWTDKSPYIDFLLQPFIDSVKIMYHLTQAMSALAKATQMDEKELRLLHESSNKKIVIPPYKMRYVKDRFLNLQKGFYQTAPYAYFYDAHQYKDVQTEDDKTPEDCIKKAKIAQEIGQEVCDTFRKLRLETGKLISPVRAFEDSVLSKLNLSGIESIPENAAYYAYEGCLGNWLEAYQIGCWERAWDYDICSAYPSFIAQQLDLSKGKWIESDKYVPEARYAECICKVNIKSKITPVMYRTGERNNLPLNYTPIGERPTLLGKRLIDWIMLNKEDDIEIKKGHWWIPDKEVKPLESIINYLYLEKEAATGLAREVIKRIMAGIYGKFLEAREAQNGINFGRMVNPVWAEDIETGTRVEVANFIKVNNLEEDVIHIAVDGVVSASPAQIGEKGLGKWELTNISPCICTGTGNVAINGKDNGNDFSLSYEKVKNLINANPEKVEYKLTKKSPVTIAEALNGKFDKLGELQDINKVIGIGQDEKRCYRERPKNGGELLSKTYKSEPWDISMISNLREI